MLAFDKGVHSASQLAKGVNGMAVANDDDDAKYHDPFNVRWKLADSSTPKSAIKGKQECKAKDPANCPYHKTGKYANAPQDMANITDWFNGMFVENRIKPESTNLEVSSSKRGRIRFSVVVDPKNKWQYFDVMKANLMHNKNGISLYDLISYNRKTHTFSGEFNAKGFVETSKGEKNLDTLSKDAKGKKPVVPPKRGASPQDKQMGKAEKPPVLSAAKANEIQKSRTAKAALAKRKAALAAKKKGGVPKNATAKDTIAAALKKARTKKVFARVNAKRNAKKNDKK